MSSSSRRFLVAAIAVLATTAAISVWADTLRDRINTDPDFRIYAVIFGITVPTDSSAPTIRLAKVTDPTSGTTDGVAIEVSDEYIRAAISKIEENKYEPKMENGESVEFFTYFLYAPSHPDVVIVDIDKSVDRQP